MRIGALYGRHRGETVYVCGTGPSMRLFPLEFLAGKTTIGLNQFWKYAAPTYALTVHPELLQEYERAAARPQTCWVVKKKPPMDDLGLDDPRYYVFHTDRDLKAVHERPEDTLHLAEGVQCTALDLAARLGAAAVVLVGCDMAQIGVDHHGHDQHVRFLGLAPAAQYQLYRKRTAMVRRVLRDKFKVPVLTLTPFVGAGHPDEDYHRQCIERGLPKHLPRPKDVSPYRRKKPK
jgi:hypothetical protein